MGLPDLYHTCGSQDFDFTLKLPPLGDTRKGEQVSWLPAAHSQHVPLTYHAATSRFFPTFYVPTDESVVCSWFLSALHAGLITSQWGY